MIPLLYEFFQRSSPKIKVVRRLAALQKESRSVSLNLGVHGQWVEKF